MPHLRLRHLTTRDFEILKRLEKQPIDSATKQIQFQAETKQINQTTLFAEFIRAGENYFNSDYIWAEIFYD